MQIGFFGLLTLVFVTLKLIGYIDWSWWLVLLPAYGGFVVLFILIILLALLGDKPRFVVRRKK